MPVNTVFVSAMLAVVVGGIVASVAQVVTIRQQWRAERALVDAIRHELDATTLAVLRETLSGTASNTDRSTLYERLTDRYVRTAMLSLREEERRRLRAGLEQPSIVGRARYAQKILVASAQ